jgi:hypothetical protein
VRLHFIEPGKPTQNAFIESFNGSSAMNAFCSRGLGVKLNSIHGRGMGSRFCPRSLSPHDGHRR